MTVSEAPKFYYCPSCAEPHHDFLPERCQACNCPMGVNEDKISKMTEAELRELITKYVEAFNIANPQRRELGHNKMSIREVMLVGQMRKIARGEL